MKESTPKKPEEKETKKKEADPDYEVWDDHYKAKKGELPLPQVVEKD